MNTQCAAAVGAIIFKAACTMSGDGLERATSCEVTWRRQDRRCRQGELFKTRHLQGVEAFPGVRELFERLRNSGVKRVLGSSGKPEDVETAEAIQVRFELPDRLSLDPVDDCTFFYTNEYLKTSGTFNWNTEINSLKFPGCS